MFKSDMIKLFRKYIQDKGMHYKYYKQLQIKNYNNKNINATDYERGFLAGSCHALKLVTKDLQKDNENIDALIENNLIGTGLKWCGKEIESRFIGRRKNVKSKRIL